MSDARAARTIRPVRNLNRREFIFVSGAALTGLAVARAAAPNAGFIQRASPLRWTREPDSRLFTGVSCDGTPLAIAAAPGLLDGMCRWSGDAASAEPLRLGAGRATATRGPLRLELRHQLRDGGAGCGDDVLEATLEIKNLSGDPQRADVGFATSAQPLPRAEQQRVYLPLSAAGLSRDGRFAELGVKNFLDDCDQPVGAEGLCAHYLEPAASVPGMRETRALLLAPVVDAFHATAKWRVALFTPSDEPVCFSNEDGAWCAGRQLVVPPRGSVTVRCWLMLHEGDAAVAWRAFHKLAHKEDFPSIGWTREFKVHYYDFLSAAEGANKKRGDGYEADAKFFREFRVGLATQHGYYPTIGDYIQPDRKRWLAMRGDKAGAAEMSLEKMRARIKAARAAGAMAAVYLHPALFDDAAPLFGKLRDCVTVDAQGKPMSFGWQGPDTAGHCWRGSLASRRWREHLLQQAEWIMDLLKPDAIAVDETFAGIGYDHHPERNGAVSAGAIEFYRKLRALVRSFGGEKAVLGSDCSMSGFVLWLDGECGDHAYAPLLGHPLYAQSPVRYLAALGDKPWRPCAWHFQKMWDAQMRLARQTGAGVGVSNGWIEYTGLAHLPSEARAKILADIASLK